MRTIMYMSLAELLMNVTSMMGFPEDGSFLCWLQGLLQVAMAISSWLWATVLSFMIYRIVINGRFKFNMPVAHLLCWGLPVVLALLPLTTSRYGAAEVDYQWCVMVPRAGAPVWAVTFWSYASFFFWLFLCSALMLSWIILAYHRLVWQRSALTDIVIQTYDRVWVYPLLMICCWILNYVVVEFSDPPSALSVYLSMIFGVVNPVFSSVVFFCQNVEIRSRWQNYILGKPLAEQNFAETRQPVDIFDVNNDENCLNVDVDNLELSESRSSTDVFSLMRLRHASGDFSKGWFGASMSRAKSSSGLGNSGNSAKEEERN